MCEVQDLCWRFSCLAMFAEILNELEITCMFTFSRCAPFTHVQMFKLTKVTKICVFMKHCLLQLQRSKCQLLDIFCFSSRSLKASDKYIKVSENVQPYELFRHMLKFLDNMLDSNKYICVEMILGYLLWKVWPWSHATSLTLLFCRNFSWSYLFSLNFFLW